jgi:hypothetical protein
VDYTRLLPSHGMSLTDALVPCGADETGSWYSGRNRSEKRRVSNRRLQHPAFRNLLQVRVGIGPLSTSPLYGQESRARVSLPWPSQHRVPEVALGRWLTDLTHN